MPTNPINGYVELASPQTLDNNWRELNFDLPARQNVMLDNAMPEWAAGYVYKDAKLTGSASHNRFLYWRSYNETLELVEMSSEVMLEGNQVRIHFVNSSVINAIDVIEFSDSVCIMVATLTSVHRFCLPHPKMTDKSVLDELNVDILLNPANYYILSNYSQSQHQQPICAASWYEKSILKCAVSFPDSSILIVQFSRNSHHVTTCEIKQNGIIGRLWSRMPNLLARNPNDCDNAVFASAPMYNTKNNDVLLFTLCRDCKIRVFSTSTRECVLTHNMVPQSSFSQSFASHTNLTTELPMMKIYRSHVVVYLTENRPEFVIMDYSFENDVHNLKEMTTIHTPIWEKLIDFNLTEEKIWALANIRETESTLCYANLQNVLEDSESGSEIEGVWDFVNLAEDSDSPSSVKNLVGEIFWRNSFSVSTVQKALMGVVGPNLPKKDKMEELEELAFTRIVDSDQDEVWTRFYNYCLQNHQTANKTVGLVAACDESVVSILRRNNPTIVCPWLMSTDMVLQGGPYRGIEFSTSLRSVIEPLNYVSTEILDDEMSHAFEQKLYENPADIMAIASSTAKNIVKNKKISVTKLYLSNKTSLSTGIDFICEQLDLTNQSQEFNERTLKGLNSNLRSDYTPLGSNSGILATFELFKRLVRARMILARDLLIYTHLIDELAMSKHLPAEKRLQDLCEDLFTSQKCRRIADSLRSYATLVWLCDTPVKAKTTQIDTGIINLVAKSFEFFKNAHEITEKAPKTSVEISLHRNLFMNFLSNGALKFTSYGSQIGSQTRTLSGSFFVTELALDLCKLLWPKSDHLCIQEFMFTHQLDEHLTKHLDMTSDWVENCENDRHFIRASNCLSQNRAMQSVDIFNRLWMSMSYKNLIGRFIGIETDRHDTANEFTMSVNPSLIYRYYEKLLQLFQIGNNYQCLVTLINNCLSLLDENADQDQKSWINCFRAKLFRYYLELEDSDEAYHTMVLTSDASLRTNCLRKFIVSHCEKEQWSSLLSFPFIDIKDDFIEILDQKAESSDLSKLTEEGFYKTSYYDLLFASYVSDEEYKRAAEVMYTYAQRLAHEVPGLISIRKQTDCLLTALNALRCLSAEDAFIECNPTNQQDGTRGSVLKRSYDSEPDSESQVNGLPANSPKQCTRVYCKDIETMYELTRARLRLLDKDQTSNAIALSPLRPEETIGQLVASSMFACAMDLALLMKIRMENILEGLTAKYIFIMRLSSIDIAVHQDLERGLSDIFSNSYSTIDTYNYIAHSTSPPVDKLWHLIDYYLNTYDGISHQYRDDMPANSFTGSTVLMKVVAVKLLSAGYDIPAPLRRMYLGRNTAELLKLLIKYDKLVEAADLAVEMINKILEPSNCFAFASPFATNELPPVYLPTHLIILLITYLNEDATNKAHLRAGENLTEKLNKFRSILKAY